MSVQVCRLCGKDGTTNVFDETDLWRKIFVCFGVEINTNDKISQKICKSCYFFTNSVYEFRLSSIEHDNKLKKHCIEVNPKVEFEEATSVPISYPSEISQDAFLNTLNLASKTEVCIKKPVFHSSVVKLKRKWPNINIPTECYPLNIDPFISLGDSTKLLKLSSPSLGVWSVRNKINRGNQPDLVLTRVRTTNNSTESLLSSTDNTDSLKVKFNFKFPNAPSEQPSTSRSVSPSSSPPIKKRKKYPDWRGSKRKRRKCSLNRRKTSTPEKLKRPKKVPNTTPKDITPKDLTNVPKAGNSSISSVPKINIEKERTALKHLLETDAHLNETLPRRRSSERPITSSSPALKNEDYGNLLVAAGEEVQTFICVTCNKIFDTLSLLNNHKRYSHKSSLRCTKCSKRFAIVENLVKHNLACHPEKAVKVKNTTQDNEETVAKVNDTTTDNQETVANENGTTTIDNQDTFASTSNTTKENQSTVIRSSVARKHTSGIKEPKKSPISARALTPPQPEILEYIISDDDDVEITDVIENAISSDSGTNKESPLETIIKEALKPQKSSSAEERKEDCLYDALIPQIASVYTENNQKETVESQIPEVIQSKATHSDDIFLIDDSDDEEKNDQEQRKSTTHEEEEQSFVILDDSNSSKDAESNTSNAPSTSTDTRNTKADGNVSQKIVVVPSAEDKDHMDSSSVKAKITNELSYINYIFSKCNYTYMKGENPNEAKSDKRWFLKDIQKFTEKTSLPVILNKVIGEDASIEYAPFTAENPTLKLPFWDSTKAIDVTKKIYPQKPEPPPKQIISKESSFVSQPVAKKSTAEKSVLKQSRVNTVGPTAKSVTAKITSIQTVPPLKQKCNSPVVVRTLNFQNPASTSPVAITTSTVTKTTDAQTTMPVIARTTNTQTSVCAPLTTVTRTTDAQTASSVVARTANIHTSVLSPLKPITTSAVISRTWNVPPTTVQTVAVQPETKVVSLAPSSKVGPTPTTMSTPVALVRTTNIQNTSNIVSNTMYVVNQNCQQGGTIQVVSSSSNGSPPRTVSSVAVPPTSNIDIQTTQRLLNMALQNAVMNCPPPKGQARPYNSSQSYSPKPALPDPGSTNETGNGYIFVGLPAGPNETSGVMLDESNDNQKQPIVLNGMSYPSFAKIRNSTTPTFVVQQLGQQTSVNIQNCINICQQEVITTNTVNEQFATGTFVIRDQSTASPPPLSPMAPIVLQSVSSIVQSQTTLETETSSTTSTTNETNSDAMVSTTRPTIRIKNLSELRGDNLNTNQRNELHNLYSNSLTNYVQNCSNIVPNQSPNDEYLQIS